MTVYIWHRKPDKRLFFQFLQQDLFRKYLQNNLKYDVVSRDDPKRGVQARSCPEMEWANSVMVGNSVDRSYNSNIVTLLCPLAVKQSDSQVCLIVRPSVCLSVCSSVCLFFVCQLVFCPSVYP